MASSGNGASAGQVSSSSSGSIGGLGSPLPSAAGMQQSMNPHQLQQQQQNGAMAQQQKVGNQQRAMAQRGRPPGVAGNVYAHQQQLAGSMQQHLQRMHASTSQLNQMAASQSPQPRLVSQMSPAAATAIRSTIFTSSPTGVQYVQQQGMRPAIVPPLQQVRTRAQAPSMLGVQGVRPAGMVARPQQQPQQMQRVQGSPGTRPATPGYPQQQQQQQQQWARPSGLQQPGVPVQQAGVSSARALTPQQQQFLIQQQQARAQQRPATPTSQQPEQANRILGKRSIQELVAQVDSREKLDPEVEDALLEIADDFIESVTTFACALAKHRNSSVLEAKDVLFHLERNWDMTLPGFGNEYRAHKKPVINESHKQRLAVVKKS